MKNQISPFQQTAARLLLFLFLLESCKNANISPQQQPKQAIGPSSNQCILHHVQATSTSSKTIKAAPMDQLQLVEDQHVSQWPNNTYSYSKRIDLTKAIAPIKDLSMLENPIATGQEKNLPPYTDESLKRSPSRASNPIKQVRDRKNLTASQEAVAAKRLVIQSSKANQRMATLLSDQICRVQGGWKVKFENNEKGALQALVESQHFQGIPPQTLPVMLEPGLNYSAAAVKNSVWQKQHIHVKEGYVYVGSSGIKGGMMEGEKETEKEKEKEKEDEQVDKKSPDEYSIKDVQDFIEIAAENAEKAKGKEIVLVLGTTGSGKSTIINYLLGSELEEVDTETGEVIVKPKDVQKEWAKIGHGLTSETFLPSVYANEDCPFVYCDCPGFNDTRTEKERLNTTIATQLIVNAAELIRSIIVVIDVTDLTHGRGAGMRDISTILSRLMKGFTEPNSILFVFNNKTGRNKTGRKMNIKGVHLKLKALEKAENEKLEKLAKMQEEGKASEKECDNSYQILSMLKMISENEENTFLIDLFDEFESKQAIEDILDGLQATSKDCFSFSEHDEIRVKFNEQLTKIVVDLLDKMMALMQAAESISTNNKKIESCEERIEFYKEQIELLNLDQKMKNEEQIPILQQQIKECKQKTEDLKKQRLSCQDCLNRLAKERAILDTDEEVLCKELRAYWNQFPTHSHSHYQAIIVYSDGNAIRTELTYNEAYNIMNPEDCKWKKYVFNIRHERSFYGEKNEFINRHVVYFEPNLEPNPVNNNHYQFYGNGTYRSILKNMDPCLKVYNKKKYKHWFDIKKYDKLLKKEQKKLELTNEEIKKIKFMRKAQEKLLVDRMAEVGAQRKKIIDKKQYLAEQLARIEREKAPAELNNKKQQKIKEASEKYLAEREQLLASINAIIPYGIHDESKLDEGFKEYYQRYTALLEQGPDYFLSFPEKELPEYLLCPLRGDVFIDPVITGCGHTFSQHELLDWLINKQKTCPTCRASVNEHDLKPNLIIRQAIEEFEKKEKEK